MKTLNLVVAIIYTFILVLMLLMGLLDNDSDLVIGVVFLSLPTIVNWISFANIKK